VQDTNNVTKGKFTMSTTRVGKVIRQDKPYYVPGRVRDKQVYVAGSAPSVQQGSTCYPLTRGPGCHMLSHQPPWCMCRVLWSTPLTLSVWCDLSVPGCLVYSLSPSPPLPRGVAGRWDPSHCCATMEIKYRMLHVLRQMKLPGVPPPEQ